ncbi:MAG: alanine racemase [Planctomycetota bacterium]
MSEIADAPVSAGANQSVDRLKTPCALVDPRVVERNTRRMSETAHRLGVRLRPHVKTHKCLEAGRLQVRGHFGGITVSTLAEARFFAEGGFDNITWAFPLPPDQLDEVFELSAKLKAFHVLVDQAETVEALAREASRRGRTIATLLKVDCGYHRAGVDPADPASVRLAARIAGAEGLRFEGVLTHGGHSYAAKTLDEIRAVSRQERDEVVGFAQKLRAAGLEVPTVSLGSTPTLCVPAEHLDGVTEVRPGNYAFFDLFQVEIGSCALEDVAFSVLATVVAHYPAQRKLMINAGALALSKDLGADHLGGERGYGRIVSMDGAEAFPDFRLQSLSQEHGQVTVPSAESLSAFPVGSKIRIIPNHSCMTAALFETYHLVEDGRVTGEWRPTRLW